MERTALCPFADPGGSSHKLARHFGIPSEPVFKRQRGLVSGSVAPDQELVKPGCPDLIPTAYPHLSLKNWSARHGRADRLQRANAIGKLSLALACILLIFM